MFMKGFSAILSLILVLGLTACGGTVDEASLPGEETTVETVPAVKPGEMVLIPAGEFIFGTDDKDNTAFPKQKVNLPAFWIDKYEVTNREFLDFSIKTGYTGEGAKEGKDWRAFVTADTASHPVVYITWGDAVEYCKSLGKRLPTEQEWEKAARGTDGFRFPWGEQWEDGRSNTYEAGLRAPSDIARYEDVSTFGAYDMLGNVQEWTASWYKPYKGGNPAKDENYGERFRVVRGMSSRMFGNRAALWLRSAYLPNSLYDFGCRCAKDATPEDVAKAGQPQ